MLRMCASNSHSYTHLIQALGIVRKPTVWLFITPKCPGTHDIGLTSTGEYLGQGFTLWTLYVQNVVYQRANLALDCRLIDRFGVARESRGYSITKTRTTCRMLSKVGLPPLTRGLFDFHFSSKIYFEVINPHTVGSLTIPRASIKWV